MRFYITTFGCQMNKADSERMAALLARAGYIPAREREQADLIIFNTCCVREHAENRLYSHLNILKSLKRKNPSLIIAVGGCVAQKEKRNLLSRFPQVDIVFGTQNFTSLPDLIETFLKKSLPLCNVNDGKKSLDNFPALRENPYRAWVPIIRGCNNFCAYCIVPYVRGPEKSRPLKEVLEEVKKLARDGVKEITLLGQNVNSYGRDLGKKDYFATLLKALDEIEELKWIRFITSHPKDLSTKIIEVVANSSKICEHFHLPLQAGSDKILKRMNRGYTQKKYLKLIETIRKTIPGVSISTDLIVGFPGEEERDFEETLKMVKLVRFDQAFTFIYSPREGTAAWRMKDNVPREVKQERLERLINLQERISLERNKELIGKRLEVFVEGKSKRSPKELAGRTRTNKIVNFPGHSNLINNFVEVTITEAHPFSLKGKLCGEIERKPDRH